MNTRPITLTTPTRTPVPSEHDVPASGVPGGKFAADDPRLFVKYGMISFLSQV